MNQEAHLVEDSHSRLREPPGAVERCSRSSYEDDDGDDGRMQGGKSIATCRPEFQITPDIATFVLQIKFEYCLNK